MLTRREMIQTAAFAAAAGSFSFQRPLFADEVQPTLGLPPLPYPADALEPHIDARTMEIHHGKHHATYVTKLNEALAKEPSLKSWSVEDLVAKWDKVPESVRTAVRNNGGGHLNHSWFWQMMGSKKTTPQGELAKALDKQFGSVDAFWEKMAAAAAGVFGSGWAWLTLAPGGALQVETTANQDNPLTQGRHALLGIDVWEHAYYLKYQNKRPDYVAAWRNVINWDFASSRYASLSTSKK
jgi:Fe-Mn family superoxide dismutase